MKKAMITRTVKTAVCNVMYANLETNEILTKEVIISARVVGKSGKNGEEAAVKAHLNDGEKFIAIKDSRIEEKLYGMTEEEFVLMAKPIVKE